MTIFTTLRQLLLPGLLLLGTLGGHAQVGIGTTTPAASAALEVKSTTGGLLLPRMTAAQRAAIPSPTPGLLVFQTDGTQGVYYYIGSNWVNLITGLIPTATGQAGPNPAIAATVLTGTGTAGFADGAASAAQFSSPYGVALDPAGTFLYVADRNNQRIRKVTISTGAVTTLAGSGTAGFADGTGVAVQFSSPTGVALDPAGTFLYVADAGNNRIRKVTISTGAVTTLAGSGTAGFADGAASSAQFSSPYGVALDPSNMFLYVADYANQRIRKVDLSSGAVTTLAGSGTRGFQNGSASTAQFDSPSGLVVDLSNSFVYVVALGQYNTSIRKVTVSTGDVTTLSGAGVGNANGITVNPSNTFLYVAGTNNSIYKYDLSAGTTTTVAGTGTAGSADGTASSAQFRSPAGVAVDGNGTVYVSEAGNNRIRVIK